MATRIRSPVEWLWEELKVAANAVGTSANEGDFATDLPVVRRIGLADLAEALKAGFADFQAARTDVAFLCWIYPVAGLVLARVAFGENALPLIFPLVAGFALVGPLFGVGIEEMSRRRELGQRISWADAFGIVRSHAFGRIVLFGLILVAIFLLWLVVAGLLYDVTLGPEAPASTGAFLQAVFTTNAGWVMLIAGIGIGFLFAVFVLAISVVTFPLLLDRDLRLETAITTSARVVGKNPGVMAAWGIIITGLLVLGSIPLLIGLVIVLPLLGHATWHLYRRVVG